MSNTKLTERSMHLLLEVAAGRNRIFYMDSKPPGFVQAERAGLMVRVAGTDQAELTPSGRLFLNSPLAR
jgi:hypothetical protein